MSRSMRSPGEGRVGGDPGERPLELAHVVGDVLGDEEEDILGYGMGRVLEVLAEDGEPGFDVGGLDVGEQTPLEPAAQPVLQRRQVTRAPGPS